MAQAVQVGCERHDWEGLFYQRTRGCCNPVPEDIVVYACSWLDPLNEVGSSGYFEDSVHTGSVLQPLGADGWLVC